MLQKLLPKVCRVRCALMQTDGPGLQFVRRQLRERREEVRKGNLGIYHESEATQVRPCSRFLQFMLSKAVGTVHRRTFYRSDTLGWPCPTACPSTRERYTGVAGKPASTQTDLYLAARKAVEAVRTVNSIDSLDVKMTDSTGDHEACR